VNLGPGLYIVLTRLRYHTVAIRPWGDFPNSFVYTMAIKLTLVATRNWKRSVSWCCCYKQHQLWWTWLWHTTFQAFNCWSV